MKRRFLSIFLAVIMLFSMIPAVSAAEYDGTVGNSNVSWSFDPLTGKLTVSGSGDCDTFTSASDQPWAHLRDQITEVWFADMGMLSISNLAYWFDGCTSLRYAEIPYTTPVIGDRAFADCISLTDIAFYYYDTDDFYISLSAFESPILINTNILTITEQQYATFKIAYHDWNCENRIVQIKDVYSSILLQGCAIGGCSCTQSCHGEYEYSYYSSSKHQIDVVCDGCGASFLIGREEHSYSGGVCTDCGATTAPLPPPCSHSSTYTSWSGCEWTDYCSSCGEEVSSGTSHSYSYGSWSYYSTSQHRRTGRCSCGDTNYSYGSHSKTTKYETYTATQHKVRSYCSVCSSYIGSTSYANHSLSYGNWSSYSDTQHRRSVKCSTCGYSSYEYGNHTDSNNDGSCDSCGYEMSRFSVTVPASLNLTVSELGEVYAASSAAIVNNSTGNVKVSNVTIMTTSSWTLVPYSRNMASEHVDSKQIGFSINGASSTVIGNSENLTLSGSWSIAKGSSLALNYDAVVSAMSEPVSEQVLSIIFTVKWA